MDREIGSGAINFDSTGGGHTTLCLLSKSTDIVSVHKAESSL